MPLGLDDVVHQSARLVHSGSRLTTESTTSVVSFANRLLRPQSRNKKKEGIAAVKVDLAR